MGEIKRAEIKQPPPLTELGKVLIPFLIEPSIGVPV